MAARIPIPMHVKREVWDSHFPEENVGTCYVCSREIFYDTYKCGYLEPERDGKIPLISNLVPLCDNCYNSDDVMVRKNSVCEDQRRRVRSLRVGEGGISWDVPQGNDSDDDVEEPPEGWFTWAQARCSLQ